MSPCSLGPFCRREIDICFFGVRSSGGTSQVRVGCCRLSRRPMLATSAFAPREAAEVSPGGRHEIVTLTQDTSTPRTRSLTASFKRERTPPGESQPARRQRKKNEGKARARAICRLNPVKHAEYKKAERARKSPALQPPKWATPIFWPEESSGSDETRQIGLLHEHVQLTPRGSRNHRFEHISPGGTTRLEQRASPTDVRATREQKNGWRSRIALARMDPTRVKCYRTACTRCGTSRLIQPDGCMMRHSIGPSLSARERVAYRETEAYAEREWECPGSRVYYGPQ